MSDSSVLRVTVLTSTVFGAQCLENAILPVDSVRLCGVLTTPSHIEISYAEEGVEISSHVSKQRLEELAAPAGAEVVELNGKISADSYLQPFAEWKPDLILVLGWYYLVPRKVRDVARLGCLGIHASLLPEYRGGAPIPWVIINDEKDTGVTLFHFEDEVDSGDIVGQRALTIDPRETCATLYEKATQASLEILRESLPKLADGSAPRVPQDQNKATYFPQRAPEDGLIDWDWDARRIDCFIRAQTRPYPGAFFYKGSKKVVIWDADVHDDGEVPSDE